MKEKEPEVDSGPAAKKRRHGFKPFKVNLIFNFCTFFVQTMEIKSKKI